MRISSSESDGCCSAMATCVSSAFCPALDHELPASAMPSSAFCHARVGVAQASDHPVFCCHALDHELPASAFDGFDHDVARGDK
eukprot:10286429-Heterocapsa_arctica.AAC.1